MTSETSASAIAYLSDHESKVDYLNNEAIAKTILRLVLEGQEKPITIGVHGDWGAGKSSVLEMVHDGLSENKDVLCLRFNGWQFQGFEDAKIALIERVVEGLIEKRSLLTKAKDEVEDVLKSINWMKAAKKSGQIAVSLFAGLPFVDFGEIYDAVVEKVSGVVQDEEQRKKALEEVEKLKKEKSEEAPSGHSIPKEIAGFRKSFKKLISKAEIKRLVVLIDDLDRCLPETAIETLEAVRLFVFLDKTAFVVGADERMIEYAVTRHFPNLPEGSNDQNYARSYLEKLIQIPFRIPSLGETETRIYVTLLLLGAALGEEPKEFEKLLALGRTALSKPWDGAGIKDEDLKQALGPRYDDLQRTLITAEQISPVLSAGTKGNPRQIKRFLNALTLRLAVAESRGFGDAIEQTHLAKLMLAEMFLPELFKAIAISAAHSPDGKCSALAALENLASNGSSSTNEEQQQESEGEASEAREPAQEQEGEEDVDGVQQANKLPAASDELKDQIADWSSRPEVMRWAKISPALGDTTLKPYLFVIKDRQNYLDGDAPLTPAQAAMVARLTAGAPSAAAAQADVQGLTPVDLDAIFKALKTQILASNSFESQPSAMLGVKAMVKAVPSLQNRYVELLEFLPAHRLGSWAASGHDPIVTSDAAKIRLGQVIDKWRNNGGNVLKAALAAMAKAPARRNRSGG